MTEIDMKAVYTKAAEIIVRDGWNKATLFGFEGPSEHSSDSPEYLAELADSDCSVCAIGACIRAEYELYGELRIPDEHYDDGTNVQDSYYHRYDPTDEVLSASASNEVLSASASKSLWRYNDHFAETVEDVANRLKLKASEVE